MKVKLKWVQLVQFNKKLNLENISTQLKFIKQTTSSIKQSVLLQKVNWSSSGVNKINQLIKLLTSSIY